MDIFELPQNPAFPKFEWKEEWEGSIVLSSWAGFQSRQGAYGGIDSSKPSMGLSKIRIDNDGDAENRTITTGQIKAIEFLLNNEVVIRDNILTALLPYYQQLRIDWGTEDEDWMPAIQSSEAFKQMIGLSWIHVSNIEKDDLAYIGFEMGCTWDDEHGLGIMLHQDRVVEIGGADVSFLWWVADKDRKGE